MSSIRPIGERQSMTPQEQCREIVCIAMNLVNQACPLEWSGSELQWAAVDAAEQLLHDAARGGNVEATTDAAAKFEQLCKVCFSLDEIDHAFAVEPCGGRENTKS